jgi:steroid 5-alpha reductase family enzyme
MDLDVRLPLGLLFVAIGLVLLAVGLGPVSVSAVGESSRIDLVWGGLICLFGLLMAGLALMGARARARSVLPPDADPAGSEDGVA